MNRLWHTLHLQTKFRLLAMLGLLIWLASFSVIYSEIYDINEATLDLERVEDLYDTVLEVRRYEKNFLLYQGQENLDETARYLHRAQEIWAELRSEQQTRRPIGAAPGLVVALGEYQAMLDRFQTTGPGQLPPDAIQEEIRTVGKRMVDVAHGILAESRSRVAVAARNALRWPLLAMGLILVLFTIGAVLVNRKVIQPLVHLEQATKKIGRGDFSAIDHPTTVESEVDRLIINFNRMVEELESRQEQIIHTRKIASLGTLVSGVAHELNNPINNIILTIDTLVGGRPITDERRADLMNDVLTQAIRASGIVKNLLDFSRAESSQVNDMDLAKLLQDTMLITGNQITLSNIKLVQEVAPDLPMMRGNRQGLQQVLINLITNAVQAMPAGGVLTIKAATDRKGRIYITVRDTGSGIPEADLPRIFDPFFTTKEVGQGTGLGLSVSYGIIKKHGGRISVDSRIGKGSTFKVVLPATGDLVDA